MKTSDLSFRCPGCGFVTVDLRPHPDPRVHDATIGDLPSEAMLLVTCGRCGESSTFRIGDSPAG